MLFFLAVLIGMLSTAKDPGFSTLILGQGYIDRTIENIEKGEPMAIYNSSQEFDMFYQITYNNLRVSFYTFVSGLLMALGTLFVLLYNGIMVGTFQYFFIERGLFWESFLTIWQHGTIEISCIIIAGAAGITLGKGLLFPGTYSRYQAFKISARRGLQIMAGIIPLIIMAGFIEGYFTRYTDAPDVLRIIVILVSLVFILGYFGWYPRKVAQGNGDTSADDYKLKAPDNTRINYSVIYKLEELITNTFKFFRQNIKNILLITTALSLTYSILLVYILDVFEIIGFSNLFTFNYGIRDLFDYEEYPLLLLMNVIVFLIITVYISFLVNRLYKENLKKKTFKHFLLYSKTSWWKYLIIYLFLNYIIMLHYGWGLFFSLIVLSFVLFLTNVFAINKLRLVSGFKYCLRLLKGNWWKLLGLYSIFAVISLVLIILISTPWFQGMLNIVLININLENEQLYLFMLSFKVFLIMFILIINIGLLVSGIAYLYYVVIEINSANNLLERIENFGQKTKILGYERET